MEAGQRQPRCQRFPLTRSEGGEKEGKRNNIKKGGRNKETRRGGREREGWGIGGGGENESAPAAVPGAAIQNLLQLLHSSVCVRTLGEWEIEFDKREIDSRAFGCRC